MEQYKELYTLCKAFIKKPNAETFKPLQENGINVKQLTYFGDLMPIDLNSYLDKITDATHRAIVAHEKKENGLIMPTTILVNTVSKKKTLEQVLDELTTLDAL